MGRGEKEVDQVEVGGEEMEFDSTQEKDEYNNVKIIISQK